MADYGLPNGLHAEGLWTVADKGQSMMTNDELQHELDGQVWRQQKLIEEADALQAELERHRALVAELRETGETWASLESDGSRDIDQRVRDGRVRCGCGGTATHSGLGDGLALMSGCEWTVRQWVRDPLARLKQQQAERGGSV